MEHFANDCQWSNCTVEYNDDLYISLNSSNGFIRVNEERQECVFLGKFPGLMDNKELFISISRVEHELYLIPKNHQYMYIYNIDDETYELLELPKPKMEVDKFGQLGYIASAYKGKIILLERKYRVICEVNTVTKDVSDWKGNIMTGDELAPFYCMNKDTLACIGMKKNGIYLYNLDCGEETRWEIGSKDYLFGDICCFDNYLWIQVKNKPILIKCNPEDKKVEEIAMPMEYHGMGSGRFVFNFNELILFPEKGVFFYQIDTLTGQVNKKRLPMLVDRKVIMYTWKNRAIFRLDNQDGLCKLMELEMKEWKCREFQYIYTEYKRKNLKPSEKTKRMIKNRYNEIHFCESKEFKIEDFIDYI